MSAECHSVSIFLDRYGLAAPLLHRPPSSTTGSAAMVSVPPSRHRIAGIHREIGQGEFQLTRVDDRAGLLGTTTSWQCLRPTSSGVSSSGSRSLSRSRRGQGLRRRMRQLAGETRRVWWFAIMSSRRACFRPESRRSRCALPPMIISGLFESCATPPVNCQMPQALGLPQRAPSAPRAPTPRHGASACAAARAR